MPPLQIPNNYAVTGGGGGGGGGEFTSPSNFAVYLIKHGLLYFSSESTVDPLLSFE